MIVIFLDNLEEYIEVGNELLRSRRLIDEIQDLKELYESEEEGKDNVIGHIFYYTETTRSFCSSEVDKDSWENIQNTHTIIDKSVFLDNVNKTLRQIKGSIHVLEKNTYK